MNTENKNPSITRNFTKVPNVLFEIKNLTIAEKFIISFILRFDECYVSQRGIAKSLGVSLSTVQRAMLRLAAFNIVRKVPKSNQRVYYVVNPVKDWSLDSVV